MSKIFQFLFQLVDWNCDFWLNLTERVQWPSVSALRAVDSGLNPKRDKPMTLKLIFTVSLFDAQH